MLDLNCDLGEGEPAARTRALMRQVTSANVACGGHTGDLASMARCARLALEFGVRLGAHPGPPGGADFGRAPLRPTASELTLWVVQQAGALAQVARRLDLPLHHIKLHGALYHASEADPDLARAYAETVREHFPGVKIYSQSGGQVARSARRAGVEVWEEMFADRAYLPDGSLVPRQEAGALLSRPAAVASRLDDWLSSGQLAALSGGRLRLAAQTLCVHGDTPGAVALVRQLRARIEAAAAA
jgi:UPF0271 protein